MKQVYLSSILLLILCFNSVLAQDAVTAPKIITSLPYIGTSLSNCDNSAVLSKKATCLENSYFSGEKHLLQYKPSKNECISIQADYVFDNNATLSGMAILTGSQGNTDLQCIDAVNGITGNDGSLILSNINVTAGQTYYIVVAAGTPEPGSHGCFKFNLHIDKCYDPSLHPAPAPALTNYTIINQTVDCGNNLGFEDGILNNWEGCSFSTGSTANMPCCPIKCSEPGLLPGINSLNGSLGSCASNPAKNLGARHTLTSGNGKDPNTDNVVPVVAPGGGGYSVRIGNHESGYQSECMSQTFPVTKQNYLFTYLYAVVLQDPDGHTDEQRPRFEITITGPNGSQVPCGGKYQVISNGASADGFVKASNPQCGGNTDVWYKNWTAVTTDLSPYIGSQVTIKFCTADCGKGGHYGYAYIDTYCNTMDITGTNICDANGAAVLTAPAGFKSYTWYSGATASGTSIGTGQTLTINNPVNNSVYTVSMQLLADPTCFVTLTDTIKVLTVSASGDTTLCSNVPGSIQLKSSSNDPAATYTWSSTPSGFSSTQQNPVITNPSQTTTYHVVIKSQSGCIVTSSVLVTVRNPAKPDFSATNVCLNNAMTFKDLSVPATSGSVTSWAWEFGEPSSGLNNTSTLQNPSHTYSGAGTYQVTLTVTTNGGCKAVVSRVVTVYPLPVSDYKGLDVCLNTPNSFTDLSSIPGGTINTWAWNFGEPSSGPNNISSLQHPTHTYAAPGTYSAILTVTSDKGCQSTATKTITVHALPASKFSAINVCLSNTTQFTDLSTGAGGSLQWLWDFGDPASGSNNSSSAQHPTHTYTTAGTFPVTLKITSDKGCQNSSSKTVTVYPIPEVRYAAASVCLGNPTQFKDSSLVSTGSITGWLWNFGEVASGGNNTSNIQNPAHTYASAGTYNVTLSVVSSGGCSATVVRPVTVYAAPTADFKGTDVCAGTATNFSNLSTLAGGTIVGWLWNFGEPSSGSKNTSSLQNPAHIYEGAGTYKVSLTITSDKGCKSTIEKTVTVFPVPLPSFTGNTVCYTNPTQFTDASTVSGGSVIQWSWDFGDPASGATNTSTLQHPKHVYSSAGSFNVRLTTTAVGGCTGIVTLPVTVHSLPVAEFKSAEVCLGEGNNFTDMSTIKTGRIASWMWNFGEPSSGSNDTSSMQHPSHRYSNAGTYSVVQTVTSDQGCTNTATGKAMVHPKPVVNFTEVNSCFKDVTPFTDLSTIASGSIVKWSWNFGDSSKSSTASPFHTYKASGKYQVVLTAGSDKGCIDSDTGIVEIFPVAIANFKGTSVCLKNTTAFTDQSSILSGNIVSWSWNFGEPGSATNTSNKQHPNHTYDKAGVFTVSLTVVSDKKCTSTVTRQVTVYPSPVAKFKNTSTCLGDQTLFSDMSSILTGSIISWRWEFGDGSIDSQKNPSHKYAKAGIYQVKLKVSSNNGCVDSTTQTITIHGLPVVKFGPYKTGCAPLCVDFTDSSSIATGTITKWLWDFGDGSTSTAANPSHCYTKDGTYHVTLSVTSNNGCVQTRTINNMIRVYPLPVADFTTNPQPATLLDSKITFHDLSKGNPVSWEWSFGDSKGDSSYSTLQHPIHKYSDTGRYTAQLVVTTEYGCKSTIEKELTVRPIWSFYIPNTFTPNGDGRNDVFIGKSEGIIEHEMWIYDRWGNMVYNTNKTMSPETAVPWDGRANGGTSSAQSDTYVWMVVVKNLFGEKHKYMGHVNIIR